LAEGGWLEPSTETFVAGDLHHVETQFTSNSLNPTTSSGIDRLGWRMTNRQARPSLT
jgi:hypothetical protein